MNNCLVITCNASVDNNNLPSYNAKKFVVNRQTDTERARTFIATGGEIVLPDGMSMTGNVLPLGEYSFIVKNFDAVTSLTVGSNVGGYDIADLPSVLEYLECLTSGTGGQGDKTQLIGSLKNTPESIKTLAIAYAQSLNNNDIKSLSECLSLIQLTAGGTYMTGDVIDFAAKQISLGRESASITMSYISIGTSLTFNGNTLPTGAYSLAWSKSGNNYIVTYSTLSITISVNSDGTWTVV